MTARIRGQRSASALSGAACLLLLAVAEIAVAHRAPGSASRIDWNARNGLTEITHRLHVHDAALGVAEIEGLARVDLTTLEGQALAALYVERRFAIEWAGEEVPLRTLGAELVDDYLLVYQETEIRLSDDDLRVANGILRDAFPDQVNEVNLRLGRGVRSLRFSGDDRWLSLTLDTTAADAP